MNMNSLWCRFAVALSLLFVSLAAASAQPADTKALIEQLRQGGYVIVFRHGATNRDQEDTDPLNPDNIAQQRQLSARGREVAAQVGEAFKALQIPIGRVYTSKFNRAMETGKLISGSEVITSLDITMGGTIFPPIENDRRAGALRKLAATEPDAGTNTVVVTHFSNILDAFGKDWFEVKEGEASIFKPTASGKADLVARLQAVEWLKAANAK